jgi:hypothetical protein
MFPLPLFPCLPVYLFPFFPVSFCNRNAFRNALETVDAYNLVKVELVQSKGSYVKIERAATAR